MGCSVEKPLMGGGVSPIRRFLNTPKAKEEKGLTKAGSGVRQGGARVEVRYIYSVDFGAD